MKNIMRKLVKEEKAVNTLEIIIIAAVLVAVALLFRGQLMDYVKNMMEPVFGTAGKATEGLETTTTALLSMFANAPFNPIA